MSDLPDGFDEVFLEQMAEFVAFSLYCRGIDDGGRPDAMDRRALNDLERIVLSVRGGRGPGARLTRRDAVAIMDAVARHHLGGGARTGRPIGRVETETPSSKRA